MTDTPLELEVWQANDTSEELGALTIASGKVQVCDAGTLMAPVTIEVPPGTWQVRVMRGSSRPSAAVLYRAGAAPTAWSERGAFPVDAGMAGIFDGAVFERVEDHEFETSIYDDLICDHLDPAEAQGHAGAFVPFEGDKFAACASGFGDGVYPVYAGTDANGKVSVVVARFT